MFSSVALIVLNLKLAKLSGSQCECAAALPSIQVGFCPFDHRAWLSVLAVLAIASRWPDSSRARAKSIGHYILGKTIGEGTFGKVKLGTHILTSERVAVKILEKERIVEVADVERVAREVHILKLIRHPHIVQLYEIIETRRQLYLIMEYASGGELFDYIVARGRVPEPEACRFFHQIIAGLEKVHAMNIVHRDLKPENLLLDEHNNIKIVDFGLSNVFRQGQLLKTACGSPCYAAPEMIAGHSYVPHLCDLWSCGVILFAMVCGYLPFEDQNTSALYKKILSADYKTPKFISESVRDLIARLLTTDPSRRFQVPDVRAHAWYRQIPEASTPVPEGTPGQGEKQDMKLEEGEDMADVDPADEAAELKQQGNSAYGRGEVEEAVRLWNLAIRRHVQELEAGKAFDEESTTLERSIYLNLAQGYLKLGDAEKALRACKVVLFADPASAKARFRAAEATLRLHRYEEARTLLEPLLDPPLPEAVRLLQKVQAEEKAQALRAKREDAEAQKLLAQRMSAGLSGFAENKPDPVVEAEMPSRMPPMADLDTVSHMTDISAEAAQAARARQARLEADEGPAPPDATFTDFDAFRSKAMKRSQKYAMAAERSRKHGEAAQRSVRLNWLRAGHAGGELEGFAAPLREELRELEAFDEKQRAAVEAEEPDTGEGGEGLSSDAAQTTQMEEMD
ncbi:KIN10 [Symbiodinium sp. CCMP2456]|nr:KIN10 [Symbiodinium sp. CCMP2456]